jgi:hypothetical protein
VPENARLSETTPVLRRAVALLDDVSEALAEPDRWTCGAWARDAAGKPTSGSLLSEALPADAASRCLLGELLHQGFVRGYRIELRDGGLPPLALGRAPASVWVAADALAHASLWLLRERYLPEVAAELEGADPPLRTIKRDERAVLFAIALNELGSYEDVIWALVLAAETLRAELDRRAEEQG